MNTFFKYSLALIALTFAMIVKAQTIDDAIRYSQKEINGSAKYVSMGGALGALGGEISSIHDNPASLGAFLYSELNFSPTLRFTGSQSTYYDQIFKDYRVNFNINNFSYVGSFKFTDRNWKTVNVGLSFNRQNNYHQNIYSEGINPSNSITDFFAQAAYGTPLSYLQDDEANESDLVFNAYSAYLINPKDSTDNNNTEYVSMYDHYGQTQRQSVSIKGKKDEFSFALGGNYMDKLLLGASLNYSSIRYEYLSDIEEVDDANNITNFNRMNYEDHFITTGYGYTFKIGAILKPLSWLRIGTSFHTPTYYTLHDSYDQRIVSSVKVLSDIRYYDLKSEGLYDYGILTPLKASGSLGFVIKKQIAIGLEYEYADFRMSRLSSNYSSSEFSQENADIREFLKAGHNVKGGIEYRLGNISIRGGTAYLGSAYKNTQINKDAYTLVYSGGIGLNFNNFYFDVAYSYAQSNYYYYPYTLSVDTEPNSIVKNTSQYVTTFGLRF